MGCERPILGVAHFKGYTTFRDVVAQEERYFPRGRQSEWRVLFCSMCDCPINMFFASEDEFFDLMIQEEAHEV